MELTVVAKSNSFKLALTSEKLSVIVFKLFTIPGTSLLTQHLIQLTGRHLWVASRFSI